MNEDKNIQKAIIDQHKLPKLFPTHSHTEQFWEHLGRAIATFGFLEEVLGKAIFAFTATQRYKPEEIDDVYQKWLLKLEHALSDQLFNLAESYWKAVRESQYPNITNIDTLVEKIKTASRIRNVLCHGSWPPPDEDGKSIPLFVDRKMRKFETKIDIKYLAQVQSHVAGLAYGVINSVTLMGWQFPGSTGPGTPIW